MNKNPPLVEKDTLYEMYEVQKLPMHTIAKRLGVSVGAIHKYIHLYKFDIHRILPPKSEEEKARISKVHKGKRLSLETRKKISDAKTKNLKGHKKLRKDGYIAIYYPSYPTSNKCGYVMEHRYVMEQAIGRFLVDGEVVHHKNHIRTDNRLENLELLTLREHASLHMKERQEKRRNDLSIR